MSSAGAMKKRAMTKVREKGVTRDRSGSTGTIEEMWKRRREEGGEKEDEEMFRSSKKTMRSPDILKKDWVRD